MVLKAGQISNFEIDRDHHDFFMIEVDRFDQPMTKMLTEFLKKRYGSNFWYVVDINGNGHLDAYVISGVEEKDGYRYLHIYSIAVRSDFEGRGWAKRLMIHLIEELRLIEPSVEFIRLEVRETNLRAIDFYAHIGFTHYGREKDYYDQGEDALLMQMNLKDYQPSPRSSK